MSGLHICEKIYLSSCRTPSLWHFVLIVLGIESTIQLAIQHLFLKYLVWLEIMLAARVLQFWVIQIMNVSLWRKSNQIKLLRTIQSCRSTSQRLLVEDHGRTPCDRDLTWNLEQWVGVRLERNGEASSRPRSTWAGSEEQEWLQCSVHSLSEERDWPEMETAYSQGLYKTFKALRLPFYGRDTCAF